MKGNEFFKALLEKIGFESEEMNAIVSSGALKELEVSDELSEKLEQTELLTLDAAKNNPELSRHFEQYYRPKISGELLDRSDAKVHAAAKALFSEEDYNQIVNTVKTQEKIELFSNIAQRVINEKIEDPQTKGKIKSLTEEVEKIRAQWDSDKEKYENEKKSLIQDSHNKLIEANVLNKVRGFKLAKEYTSTPELRSLAEQAAIAKVKAQANLRFDESGQLRAYSKDNPDLEYFEGSKKIEVDELVESAMKPYIQVSEPEKPRDRQNFEPSKPIQNTEVNPRIADRFKAFGMKVD